MRQKTLIVLAVITIPIALAAAFLPGPASSIATPVQAGPILPALAAAISNATRLTVTGPDGTVVVARKSVSGKIDRGWTLPDKGGYPVDPAKIKPVLDALVALHGIEAKTRQPGLYSRLDLGEPGKTSQAHLIALSDATDKPLATIVIGKQKFTEGGNDGGVYVRKPGDPQSWLARPTLALPTDALGWIDRAVLDITPDKIKDVVIHRTGGTTLELVRDKPGDKLVVKDLPKNAKLKSDDPGADIAGSFNLELDDVKPATQIRGTPAATARLVTFDGMAVTLTLTKQGDKTWVTIMASGSGDAAKATDAITARTKGWAYAIPDTTATSLESRLADLEQASAARPEVAKSATGLKKAAAAPMPAL